MDQAKSLSRPLGSSFHPMSQAVIETVDGGLLEFIDEHSVNIPPKAKILILENCKSLALVNPSKLLKNSQVFVIIVRLCGAYKEIDLIRMKDKVAIPAILVIEDGDSSRLFFTTTEKSLEEVSIDDSCNDWSSKCFDFNFIYNLLHSEPEKFGKFSFVFNEMLINTNACFKGKRWIDLAVEHEVLLVLKFLMLFQPDIEAFNDDKERILELAAKIGNLEFMKVLLEIPNDAQNIEAFLCSEKRRALNLISNDGLSLLMLAAQSRKTDVIRFLVECGLDVNFLNSNDQTACDFAWNNEHKDSVIELLKADSPFPSDYDWDDEPEDSKLDRISRERDTLHKQIGNNQIEEIKIFVEHNPKIRCAYDSRNQCALVTALESKSFEIYSFLRSKGFTHGIDNDHSKMLFALTNDEKNTLKFSNRKYFSTNQNGHIMDLLSRSRLGFGSEQKNFGKIQKYFEDLDAICEVQPILKIISLAKKLDIVFDFNQASIADMDPTQRFQKTVVKGRTIYENGNILIGAKSSDAEVLATTAHEFTHYAMHLLYENLGFPFYATEDEARKREFAEIVDICKATQTLNPVIENVFTYEPEEYAVELIVRVPHLLALHLNESNETTQVCKDFEKLFTFFTKRIMPDCNREISTMKAKHKIQELNNILNLRSEAEGSKIFCEHSKINFEEIVSKSENILIRSSTPHLVLYNLLGEFKKNKTNNVHSRHIFIKLKQLMSPQLGEMIREAFDSSINPKMFVFEMENVIEFAKIKTFFNYEIMRAKVVLIAKSVLTKITDEENFKHVFPIQRQIEYIWNDLSGISQKKVLSSKVLFQGLEMSLSEVLSIDSKVLEELTLEEILNLPEMKLKTFNESVPSGPSVFIKRTFLNTSDQTADPLTANDVINLLISNKSLILADDSGMGKSVSALHFSRKLKQRNPNSWVVHIDLKQHTDFYYKDDEFPDDLIAPEFFGKILKLKSRVAKKFFEHFFESGKVVFVLDGFDEISPVYSNCILEVVKAIRDSKNLLLVTTRVHLTTVLEESMSVKESQNLEIIKLQPFTFDDQVEFLAKFWSRSNKIPIREFETKARSLLESFKESATQEDFFAVPLQVRMLAEIYEKSDPTEDEIRELNIYSLYRSFMRKKTGIWIDRGPLAKEDNTTIHTESSFNILQVHQKFAVESFFASDTTEPLMLPEIDETLTDELLVRIGLLQVEESGKYLFAHQSFSEYLVADFILSHVAKRTLLSKSENLHKMFIETLHDQKFEKVRSFMNGKLELKEKLSLAVLSQKLEKSLQDEINRKFLVNFVKENLSALTTFMLVTVTLSKARKISLISQKYEHSDEALHFAAKFNNLSSFRQLWSCIESFTETSERTKCLCSTGFYNQNVLHRSIVCDNDEVSKEILRNATSCMDRESFKYFLMQEDDSQLNILNVASCSNPFVFDIVWEAVEHKLQTDDQKELLFCRNLRHRNVLFNAVAARNCFDDDRFQAVIRSILRITKSLLNYQEMRKFLFTENLARESVLHYAVSNGELEVFTILWSFIKDVLIRSDQKILWQKKSDSNIILKSIERTSFQKSIAREVISAEKSHNNLSFVSLATVLGTVDQIFDAEEKEWVAREYKAHTQFIAKHVAGHKERNPIVQQLRNTLEMDLSAEELKTTLHAEVEDGETAFQFSLRFGSVFLVERILQLADLKLSSGERQEIIQTISSNGSTILTLSDGNGNDAVMDVVCNFLVRQSDLVSNVKNLFLTTDGGYFFTNAAFRNRRYLFVVLDWFKDKVSHDDIRKVLIQRNPSSKTLALEIVESCDECSIKKFFESCMSSLDLQEVKDMILIRMYDAHNALGNSLFNPIETAVREVWNFYAKILNDAELKDLLFKNNQGRVYFKKEEHKNEKAVEILKYIVIQRYGNQESRKLFR